MSSHPTTTSTTLSQRGAEAFALVRTRVVTWRQVIPSHRIPVVTKTPFTIALGVYLSGGTFEPKTVGVTMALGAALWATLYTLNEATDLELEKRLTVPRSIKIPLYLLPILICGAVGALSPIQLIPFGAMTIGQILYCAPGFRLKRFWLGVALLSGTMNPVMRLLAGILWGTHAVHPIVYFAFICLHLSASIRTRTLFRDRDRKRGYTPIPPGAEAVGIALNVVGYIGALGVCWIGRLPWIVSACIASAGLFSVYAWSGRETRVSRLRRGWIIFAVMALIGLVALILRG